MLYSFKLLKFKTLKARSEASSQGILDIVHMHLNIPKDYQRIPLYLLRVNEKILDEVFLVQEWGNIQQVEADSGVERDVCSVSSQATLASMCSTIWSTMAVVMWRTSEFRPDGCQGVDLEPQCGSRV